MKGLICIVWLVLFAIPMVVALVQLLKSEDDEKRNVQKFINGIAIFGGGVILLIALSTVLNYWVKVMWFKELGYVQVFWTVFLAKWKYFILGYLITAAFLCVNIFFAQRHSKDLVKMEGLYAAAYGLALVLSVIAGAVTGSFWEEFLLYQNQASFGLTDPIFGNDVGFYVFSMPILTMVRGLAICVLIFTMIYILAIYGIQYGVQESKGKAKSIAERILFKGLTHLSVLGILLMAALIFYTVIARWNILFSTRGAVFGAGWTDVNVQLPVYWIFIGVAVICMIIFLVSAIAHSFRVTKIGAISGFSACFAVLVIGVWLVPALIQYLYVSPNELVKERQYIKYDIKFTRKAYGLTPEKLQVINYPVNTKIDRSLRTDNTETLGDVRIWDFRVLESTYTQTQAFRTYYSFSDVDVVRYRLGDRLVQLMCSAREMDHARLNEQSKTWQNKHLFYTHGFGLVANPVNVFLPPEGLPEYWIKNIPPESKYPELKITQPRIYFGEKTGDHVYVKAKQEEFDYPQGEHNKTFRYDGPGGVPIGSGLRKFAVAWCFDGFRLLTSNEVLPESRIMFNREIRTRVNKIAPFLHYDNDPYQVIANGELWFIWDAYTTTDMYPYSTRVGDINYIRNSVKVAMNAYTGKVEFYVFDEADPLLKTYQRIFPNLFKSSSMMPDSLRQHIRYPEDLLKIQGSVYALYHMDDPTVFYNKEDAWDVAREIRDVNKDSQAEHVVPYYVTMKIPGEKSEEFVLIYPFTPFSNDPIKHPRPNMVSWLAGRCDGKNYGKLLVYEFPKDRFINGPQQIGIRINQDDNLSKEISLWNQQGSEVIFGNLLVLPLSKFRLLYVQPIYLQSKQGKMPELKRVVVASGDKLAYGASFEDAFQKLIEEGSVSLPEVKSDSTAPMSQQELIKKAAKHYELYLQYSGKGQFAQAGKEMEALGQTIGQLTGRK